MITFFKPSHIDAIRCLFDGENLSFPIVRTSHRGLVHGVVKYELVTSHGISLIQRTYLPSASYKNSSRRYVSLDAFLNEYGSFSSDGVVDDLPF